MNTASLSNVVLNKKEKGSVNYARARAAIEECAKNRKEKRECKNIVVEHLNGKIEHTEGKHAHTIVVFPDLSKARY